MLITKEAQIHNLEINKGKLANTQKHITRTSIAILENSIRNERSILQLIKEIVAIKK